MSLYHLHDFSLREEFSDALLNCNVQDGQHLRYNGEYNTDDIDDNAGDDEDEDDDDDEDDFLPDSQDAGCDEPHALQVGNFFQN